MHGLPERLSVGVRQAAGWLAWAAALGLPAALLPRLAWIAQGLPPGAARLGLALALYAGLAAAVWGLARALVARLYLARDFEAGAWGLRISHRRRIGSPIWRPAPVESGLELEWSGLQRVFRVDVPWAGRALAGVGLWHRGVDGVARELWLTLEPADAAGLLQTIRAATGQDPVVPRGGLAPGRGSETMAETES